MGKSAVEKTWEYTAVKGKRKKEKGKRKKGEKEKGRKL